MSGALINIVVLKDKLSVIPTIITSLLTFEALHVYDHREYKGK